MVVAISKKHPDVEAPESKLIVESTDSVESHDSKEGFSGDHPLGSGLQA